MISRLLPFIRISPELRPVSDCLWFAFFNTITWSIGISTPLVLFAEQLGATAFQIGVVSSLVLLLTPVQILSTALLPRLGYKRLMLSGWGIRSFMLLVPITLAVLAPHLGVRAWMAPALIWSVFFFCLFRAIGLAANLPWFYAIIPEAVRGRYFATESVMAGTASVLTLVASAALFAVLPVYQALLVQYMLALGGSVMSWNTLRKLPEGPKPEPIGLATIWRATPRLLFAPSDYRRYLGLSVLCWLATSPLAAFMAYYLKSVRHLEPGSIMGLEIIRCLGVIAAASLIRRKIDVVGARPYLLSSLGIYILIALYWLVYVSTGFGGGAGLVVSYLAMGLAGTGWAVGNANVLPKVASGNERTLMIALYGAMTALAGGGSAVIWGRWLKPADGAAGLDTFWFQVFFVCTIVGAAVISYRLTRHPEPNAEDAEPLMVVNAILRPMRAASYLINLVEPSPRASAAQPPKSSA